MGYAYDALNRLSSVTDWLAHSTSYTYDAAGRLTSSTNPNGTSTSNSYDAANRLTGISNKLGSTVQSSYAFTLDALGNHSSASVLQPVLPGFITGTVSNSYDTENRLTSSGGTANSFDANGNLRTKGSDSLVWDFENRLKQSTLAGDTVQYQYDGLGNRFARGSGGVTKRYVLDPSSNLTKVLAETDAAGAITAYYVYGLGLVSRVLPDGSARYYQFDSRGSTVALTDASGAVTDSYAYDPFGKLANSAGSTANPYKYVGRYGVMDEGNGLNYIRARYYDPVAMRFVSKDPKAGNDHDGQSLNRYAYAGNNPVRFVDVSGNEPVTLLVIGVALGAYKLWTVLESSSEKVDAVSARRNKGMSDIGADGNYNDGLDQAVQANTELGSELPLVIFNDVTDAAPGTSLNSGLASKGVGGLFSGLAGPGLGKFASNMAYYYDTGKMLKTANKAWDMGVNVFSRWRQSSTDAVGSMPPNLRMDIPEIRDVNAYKYQQFKK